MREVTREQLAEILSLHKQWRVSMGKEGSRAYLRDANLCDADLRGANLCDAYLRGADLCDADLRGAYLRGAYLRDAYLRDANLRGANLCDADLRGAYLRDADLRDANGMLQIGSIEGWIMYAVRWEDGPRIHAGCRWFTLAEAREYWGPGCADRREHGDLMLSGVEALVAVAKAHGWPT